MTDSEYRGFCPLTNGECRSDCQWADNVSSLTEDGFRESTVCAIARIAAASMAWHCDPDDDDWVWDE